ncbi:tetratricopeptide repeat protein [Candidatus Falkowbacteria bacterium]|nr:tetratricopeptide repeat protein [Candidatus Falkowbacteria bacterium]
MIFYIIPTIIIIASLVIIIFIIFKKIPSLAAINVESIAKEKESKVINKILMERLGRGIIDLKKAVTSLTKPVVENLTRRWNSLYRKALEIENENLKKSQPLKKIDLKQKIRERLIEAEKFIAEENFNSAEETCISVLEIDSVNPDAYEILSKIYRGKKDYKKARETCRFLLKLLNRNKALADETRLANCYADLGLIYQLENKPSSALKSFEKAIELEPNNPRFLDFLLKISIILKDKNKALEAFNNLKQADPDNKKLPELKGEIDSL